MANRARVAKIGHQQRGMRLARRDKGFLHAEVERHARRREPAPAAGGEVGRLGLFDQTQHFAIESPRLFLATPRYGELHVVETCDH